MNITNFQPSIQEEISPEDIRLSERRAKELNDHYTSVKLPANFYFHDNQLMYQSDSKDGQDPPSPIFICGKLDVVACTRDHANENYGRLLEFVDIDRRTKRWPMPMEMLAGSGEEYRRELLSMGLTIAPGSKARSLLTMYIQSSTPARRVLCVPHTGWYKSCFVLPNETIGDVEEEKVTLQSISSHFPDYSTAGTLDEWRQNIAALCQGNSNLIFSVSLAFSPILLSLSGMESGGFHFRGASSTGKTTALSVAASVWGGKEYVQTWRATSNGIEAVAAGHNDALLCLDELAQIDPSEIGGVVYMLANGAGKGRSDRNGQRRKRALWRSIFFSTGEISLETHMQQGGGQIRGGQAVRFLDIAADTHKYKAFETLHGYQDGASFSVALTNFCRSFHGTASREFLRQLIEKKPDVSALIKTCKQELMDGTITPSNCDGQVYRAMDRFALVAAAGELATGFGITGWCEEDAFYAVKSCFKNWLELRGGTGSLEEQTILSKIRRFFEQNGESRFSLWDAREEHKTINRAGFRKKDELGAVEFFVFSEAFRCEIAAGFDPALVTKVCMKHGLLRTGSKGEPTRSERLPGNTANTRCYRFTEKVLGVEENGQG